LLDIGSEEARSAVLRGVESEMGRSMNVQILRVLEEKNLSGKDFGDYRKELRKQLTRMEGSAKILDPELRKISERGSTELSKASGSEAYVAGTFLRVHDKVINLYGSADSKAPAERK
jgi:hypothetical protein